MGRSLCLRGVEGVLQGEEVESSRALGRAGRGGRGIHPREGLALGSIRRSDSLGLWEDSGAWGGGGDAAATGEEDKSWEKVGEEVGEKGRSEEEGNSGEEVGKEGRWAFKELVEEGRPGEEGKS